MRREEKEKCIEFLDKNGYLEYGKIIPRDVFEYLFDEKFESTWDFLGPFLSLKEALQEQGYLCTSENQENGYLRIYTAEEMSLKANMIMKNSINRFKKLQNCMINAKSQEFNQKEYRLHLHTANKVSIGLRALTSSLAAV